MQFPDIELEKKLWSGGLKYVVGIDEAGRGPLAGPVCAGAVLIDEKCELSELVRDSKKMTEKRREEVFEFIKENSLGWGVCMVSNMVIDKKGIQEAVRIAMWEALKQVEKMIGRKAEYLIVDGTNVSNLFGYDMLKIKAGDLKHYSISAASILAKVTRDRYMKDISIKYPEYGFERHVGYGTKAHIEAIQKYGPCDIHRRSFKPISLFK